VRVLLARVYASEPHTPVNMQDEEVDPEAQFSLVMQAFKAQGLDPHSDLATKITARTSEPLIKNWKTAKIMKGWRGSGVKITAMTLSPSKRTLIIGDAMGELAIWDHINVKRLISVEAYSDDAVDYVVASSVAVVTMAATVVKTWTPGLVLMKTMTTATFPHLMIRGSSLFVGTTPDVNIYDVSTLKNKRTWQNMGARALAAAPDGSSLCFCMLTKVTFVLNKHDRWGGVPENRGKSTPVACVYAEYSPNSIQVLLVDMAHGVYLMRNLGSVEMSIKGVMRPTEVPVEEACFIGNDIIAAIPLIESGRDGIYLYNIKTGILETVENSNNIHWLTFCNNDDTSQPPKLFCTNEDGFIMEWSPWFKKPKPLTARLPTAKSLMSGYEEYEMGDD
jgi:hypothetical protein